MLLYLIILSMKISMISGIVFPDSSSSSSYSPFSFGTSLDTYNAALAYGIQFPSLCTCTYPCSSSTASLFVLFFYFRSGESFYYSLNSNASSIITSTDRTRPIKFLLHDYADKVQFNGTGWMEPMGKALANAINGLVIIVNWGTISNCNYTRTITEVVPAIGSYLAQVISSSSLLSLDPTKIESVGHGLGAHIAGIAGVSMSGTISRITALDPTGDTFSNGLSSASASFVQVLHTDVIKYGTSCFLGAADFFANQGSTLQPGCSDNYCSHIRAVLYYYASILSQYLFLGTTCGLCVTSVCSSRFGLYNDQLGGVFCFSTTSCFPYSVAVTTTTTATTATTLMIVYQPQIPTQLVLIPRILQTTRKPCRKRKGNNCRNTNRKCKRPCRKRCRRNCRCCSIPNNRFDNRKHH